MSESFQNNNENLSPAEFLRRSRKVLERISQEAEEEEEEGEKDENEK